MIISDEIDYTTMWWGYLHSNNTVQLKRWSGDHRDYLDDCIGNSFVVQVVKPFSASSQKEALKILKSRLASIN